MDAAAKITSKGLVTIPEASATPSGSRKGDQVVVRVEGNSAVLARTPDLLELAGTVMTAGATPPTTRGHRSARRPGLGGRRMSAVGAREGRVDPVRAFGSVDSRGLAALDEEAGRHLATIVLRTPLATSQRLIDMLDPGAVRVEAPV